MLFNELKLIEPVLRALEKEGYVNPTPIQQKAIPVILDQRDLLGCAQTGTGKTAAFAIPVLQLMFTQKQLAQGSGNGKNFTKKTIQTLVLVPTRELALQVEESFKAYGRYLGFQKLVVFGGVSQYHQVKALRNGIDVLVATPGRLLDLISQRHISLQDVKYFILDEADRMLDMGFSEDVKKIIRLLPVKKQTLFFSATMPPAIRQLANHLLVDPVKVEVAPPASVVDIISQSLFYVDKQNKRHLLVDLLNNESVKTALVFTRTKHGADKLAKHLNRSGIKADAIHGNKSQRDRERSLNNFKSNRTRILVATDIAARGIDIDLLSHVVNYELPESPETYVHRIGRTGRAGASGNAISFCDYEEKVSLAGIQKLIGKKIEVVKGHAYDVKMMHPLERTETQASNSFRRPGMGKRYGKVFQQAR